MSFFDIVFVIFHGAEEYLDNIYVVLLGAKGA